MAMHTARAQLDEVVVVAETGHNVVLEAPEVLGDLVNHAVTRRPSPS